MNRAPRLPAHVPTTFDTSAKPVLRRSNEGNCAAHWHHPVAKALTRVPRGALRRTP
jgi:hypothetical protein